MFLRIIDANLNRLREGIRVIEDIHRYLYNDAQGASELKTLRHQCRYEHAGLLAARDSLHDVLRPSTSSETHRDDLPSLLVANYKRTQEASRVLEEILKLLDVTAAERFKSIRYRLYTLEQSSMEQCMRIQNPIKP